MVLLGLADYLKRRALAISKSPHPAHPRTVGNVYNTARFNAGMTAFLAAMAPQAFNRFLVIRYAIQEIQRFKPYMRKNRETGELEQWLPSKLHEWYAFHLLRRMFRMRFGCSMFPQEEQSGRIDDVRLTEDAAWIAYKEGAKKACSRLKG